MDMIDASTPGGRAKINHVLIMVHGIRDFGEWEQALEQELPKDDIATVAIKYGYFDAFRFLFPFSTFRKAVIVKVAQRVRDAQALYPNAKYSYLAHSFGTYVVAHMLLRDPSFQAHRIIFCGSVLPADFPIAQLRCNFSAPVLNDIGIKDIWPMLAASATWGYGSAGSTGFGQAHVKDRYFPYKHGDFLTAKFAQDFWLPFLVRGEAKPGIAPPPAGLLKRLLSVVSLKYVLLLALFTVAAFIFWQQPTSSCSQKWLGKEAFGQCSDMLEADNTPLVIEGRRGWFGFGDDEFKASWVPGTRGRCYYSRSRLNKPDFTVLNGRLSELGYYPASVRSFSSSSGTELFQSVWIYITDPKDDGCPVLPED